MNFPSLQPADTALYTGKTKLVIEIAYAVSIGIYEPSTRAYHSGCTLRSEAILVRRAEVPPSLPYRSLARVLLCWCVGRACPHLACVFGVCGLVWQVQVRFEARIHTTGTLALAASKSNNIIADPSIMGKELATQAQAEGIVAPAVGQVGVVVTTHDGVVNPTPGTTQQTGYTGSSAGLLGNLSQGETILVLLGLVVVCAVLFALVVCVCLGSAERQSGNGGAFRGLSTRDSFEEGSFSIAGEFVDEDEDGDLMRNVPARVQIDDYDDETPRGGRGGGAAAWNSGGEGGIELSGGRLDEDEDHLL
jgi:hypothetical protein